MVTFGDVHQQMSGKNSNWLSDIKQCIHYKEPDLDCTLEDKSFEKTRHKTFLGTRI